MTALVDTGFRIQGSTLPARCQVLDWAIEMSPRALVTMGPFRCAPDHRGVTEVYPCRARPATVAWGTGPQSDSLAHVSACRRPRLRPGLQAQVAGENMLLEFEP